MRFEWDPTKDEANQRKHDLGFEEASGLFTSGSDYLEIADEEHSVAEDRFIAIGSIRRGVILRQDPHHQRPLRYRARDRAVSPVHGE